MSGCDLFIQGLPGSHVITFTDRPPVSAFWSLS